MICECINNIFNTLLITLMYYIYIYKYEIMIVYNK